MPISQSTQTQIIHTHTLLLVLTALGTYIEIASLTSEFDFGNLYGKNLVALTSLLTS